MVWVVFPSSRLLCFCTKANNLGCYSCQKWLVPLVCSRCHQRSILLETPHDTRISSLGFSRVVLAQQQPSRPQNTRSAMLNLSISTPSPDPVHSNRCHYHCCGDPASREARLPVVGPYQPIHVVASDHAPSARAIQNCLHVSICWNQKRHCPAPSSCKYLMQRQRR